MRILLLPLQSIIRLGLRTISMLLAIAFLHLRSSAQLSSGTVNVSVQDELTFVALGAPLVAGAHVVISDLATSVVHADGFSNASGVFSDFNIPEGTLQITVSQPAHSTYEGTFTMDPGATLDLSVFISLLEDSDNDGYAIPLDCNDADPSIHPGATEICGDGIDNDCDGIVDVILTYFADTDADGFGDPAAPMSACSQPNGYVANDADNCPTLPGVIGSPCDDGDPDTFLSQLNSSCTCVAVPQTGDYQSVGTGQWELASTWEVFGGSTFAPAAFPPDSTSGWITIRAGHEVTVSSTRTADQVIVQTNGTLTLAGSGILVVNDRIGDDVRVSGTIALSTGVLDGFGSVVVRNGAQFIVNNSGRIQANSVVNVEQGGTIAKTGINFLFFGGTINNAGTFNMNGGVLTNTSQTDPRIFNNLVGGVVNINSWRLETLGWSLINMYNAGTINKNAGPFPKFIFSGDRWRNLDGGVVNVNSGILQIGPNGLTPDLVEQRGTFNISSGTTLQLSSNFAFRFFGTAINNNGTLGTPELLFLGTTPQALNGNGTIPSLTIASPGGVTLGGTQTITSNLTLTSGTLTLGNNDLIIGSSAMNGGSATSYLITNGTGSLRRTIPSNGNSVFPVGTDGSYLPATVQLDGASTTDEFRVRVVSGVSTTYDVNDLPTGTSITSAALQNAWVIREGTAGGSNAALTLQWNALDEASGFTSGACRVARNDGTSWDSPTDGSASGIGPYALQRSGITDFGPFTVLGGVMDLCPGGPEPGTPCDDGSLCTINDVIGADCLCAGTFVDTDNDGTCDAEDCAPNDPAIHPGALEICDGVDNNCNGEVNEDFVCGCPPVGQACDDGNPCTINDVQNGVCLCIGTPATEICDGIDNDCDGLIDEGLPQQYTDNDGDGFGDPLQPVSCSAAGVTNSADCDDTDAAIFPGAPELCDGIDNDCNGTVDDGIDLSSDSFNCGQCGIICPNGSSCVNGVCVALPPPSTPVILASTPVSPSNSTTPSISGLSDVGTTVSLYASANCQGAPTAVTGPLSGTTFNQQVVAGVNTITVFSARATNGGGLQSGCSFSFAYEHDDIAPPPPTLIGTTPVSPAVSTAPTINGLNDESGATIALYASTSCNGPVAGTSSNASSSFTISTTVGVGSTTSFTAHAIDAAGNVSTCSNTLSYTSEGTAEICDGIDNDGDGLVDEDYVCGCPPAGTPCDDGRYCTANDVENGACGCFGTPRPAGTACSDGDPNSVNDMCNGAGICVGTYINDSDGDGFSLSQGDCDDANAAIHPGAAELCDGLDNDCDGQIDEGFPVTYADNDGDGFGDPNIVVPCTIPGVENGDDCDDNNPNVFPGQGCGDCSPADIALMLANTQPTQACVQNCYGAQLNNLVPCLTDCYVEAGYSEACATCVVEFQYCAAISCPECQADPNSAACIQCRQAAGCDAAFSACSGLVDADMDGHYAPFDCDDNNASVYPGALEGCVIDGLDNDCDGLIDEDALVDADGDGSTLCDGDCNDLNSDVHPGATELCNGIDDDCDGIIDNGFPAYFVDGDGDGFGDPNNPGVCGVPGHVTNNTDCDDADPTVYPGAPEICDGLDNDCSGTVDDNLSEDLDGDGFTPCQGDCDDGNATIYPGAPELCDGLDNDCNGAIESQLYADTDGDGYGDAAAPVPCGSPGSTNSSDCDDSDPLITLPPAWFPDSDGDGYGVYGPAVIACSQPTGYARNTFDCDDADAQVFPGQGCTECSPADLALMASNPFVTNPSQACIIGCGSAIDAQQCFSDCIVANGLSGPCADCFAAYAYCLQTTCAVCMEQPDSPACIQCQQNAGCKEAFMACSGLNDDDNDGYFTPFDCDDSNPTIHPDATELCDGLDNDCDGFVDEGFPVTYADNDGDGFGDFNIIMPCDTPGVANGDDCDDSDPNLTFVGATCDDGDPGTSGDVVTANCQCVGVPTGDCTQTVTIEMGTDGGGLRWSLLSAGSNAVVQSSPGYPSYYYPPASPNYTETTCLPDGEFHFVFEDEDCDGVVAGGYIVRVAGKRVIDNRTNLNNGCPSQTAGTGGVNVPTGADRLITQNCDRMDLRRGFGSNNCSDVITANDTYGLVPVYQFWFYDPNGGLSFTYPPNGPGGVHVSLTSLPSLVAGTVYNVRVRSWTGTQWRSWGAACRMRIDNALGQCKQASLVDDPGRPNHSCGKSIALPVGAQGNGGANQVVAWPVTRFNTNCVSVNANKYQFRFRIIAENVVIVRTSSNYNTYMTTAGGFHSCQPYEVEVRASFDGGTTWCAGGADPYNDLTPWGDVCLVYTGGCIDAGTQNRLGAGRSEQGAVLKLYPNPNRGDQLFVSLDAIEEGVNVVSVDIYDTYGKRVSAHTLAVNDGFINTVLELNGELANGLYLVNISAGGSVYTERLMIQK